MWYRKSAKPSTGVNLEIEEKSEKINKLCSDHLLREEPEHGPIKCFVLFIDEFLFLIHHDGSYHDLFVCP